MLTDAEIASLANFRTELVPEVDTVFGASNDPVNSTTAQTTTVGSFVEISLLLPDAATTTYKYTIPDKIEIVDVICIKDAAGAANTLQLKNSAGTAISDAIAFAVDKTVTRAGTLDKATRVIAAGGELQVTNTRAAGSSAGAVFIKAIRRD
jgi:hypothetical protein